jgi:cyanophycinase
MADVYLLGGGRDAAAVPATYGRFVRAAGRAPTVACVVLDGPGHRQYQGRFAAALRRAGAADVVAVVVGPQRPLHLDDLDGADGVFVAGGLTPTYVAALAGVRPTLGPWLHSNGVPYAGFSAGAVVASHRAIAGGWRLALGGRRVTVCPEEVSQGLAEVTVVAGLGLVDVTVEAHATAWGTVSRLVAAVGAGCVGEGWAIDEDTMLAVEDDSVSVHGAGRVYHVTSTATGVHVRTHDASFPVRGASRVSPLSKWTAPNPAAAGRDRASAAPGPASWPAPPG